jgi:hypothetical protein
MSSRLSELQRRTLDALGPLELEWTLTGGGALAGFHLGHRVTDDLRLCLHGRSALDEAPRVVEGRLRELGFDVEIITRAPSFVRFRVESGPARVVVDLVAEPVPTIEPPMKIDGVRVDTRHEILVNKLCALVSRSELRDLEDARALVEAGGDLDRALADAPKKDGGFSPMTLVWLLDQLDLSRAPALGFDAARLDRFRAELIARLDPGRPGEGSGATT